MAAAPPFWRVFPGGVSVAVKVTPKSRRPGLGPVAPDADGTRLARLAIAVSEPPEDGRANHAACATLARALGIPPSTVTVTTGASSRRKTLRVTGDPAHLAAKLAAL